MSFLSIKQRQFCKIYCTDFLCFGNATVAYARAYGVSLDSARRSGSRLLTNVDILSECNRLLREACNKDVTDIELGYLIRQRKDLMAKVSAIKLYNQLHSRVTESKEEVMSGVQYFN